MGQFAYKICTLCIENHRLLSKKNRAARRNMTNSSEILLFSVNIIYHLLYKKSTLKKSIQHSYNKNAKKFCFDLY